MLEVPEHARARGYATEEVREGRLFDRLLGRQAAKPSDPFAPEGASSSAVRPVSAIEPIPPRDLSRAGRPAPAPLDDELGADDDGFQWSDLYPSNVAATVKEITGYGPSEDVARALYQEGEDLFRQRRFKEAASIFKQGAKRAPESPLQEDCLFMAGESLFFSDQYPKATETYAELLKQYENTRYLDLVVARQFAVGDYWEKLHVAEPGWLLGFQFGDRTRPTFDTWGHAIKAYRSVQMNDPTGPLADDSIMAVANAYFVKGRYEDAAFNYDLIRKDYPKSTHQLNARLLGLKSKMQTYQGPMYDGTPLEEAAGIADQTLVQFGSELGGEGDRLIRERNEILEKQAERDWAMAQYYDRKKYYRAARYYYRLLLDEYPTTAFAEKANARLIEIQNRPDVPPNRFKWLTSLFPSTTR
jgi:outer membrane protein assembly factor BamD (BamD/ComL family)